MTTEPVLGVLGGMGPAATADFLMRLARLTPAERDQDHVPTIVYSDPQTPDRSDAILGIGPSPLPAMIRGIDFLNQAGCSLIVIPCNGAHYWYDELAQRSTVPLLHIVDSAAQQLEGRVGAGSAGVSVGIMATDGTIRSGIYRERLGAFGMTALDLTDLPGPNPVMRGIRALKAGQEQAARESLLGAGAQLVDRGANALVVACTDVSVALSGVTSVSGAPLVDASERLAFTCLEKLGKRPLAPADAAA